MLACNLMGIGVYMLEHGIRVMNDHVDEGLLTLIKEGVEADNIVTHLRKECFGMSGITEENIKTLGDKLDKVLVNGGHMFCTVDPADITTVIKGFEHSCFDYRDLLVIPVIKPEKHKRCPHHRFTFRKEEQIFVLHFTHGLPKYFRLTKLFNKEEGEDNVYPANWHGYFKGDTVKAYEYLIKICSMHGDTILDPYMMYGDVGVACIRADRHFIGIEGSHLFRNTWKRLDLTRE
jgi:hypothetical protein